MCLQNSQKNQIYLFVAKIRVGEVSFLYKFLKVCMQNVNSQKFEKKTNVMKKCNFFPEYTFSRTQFCKKWYFFSYLHKNSSHWSVHSVKKCVFMSSKAWFFFLGRDLENCNNLLGTSNPQVRNCEVVRGTAEFVSNLSNPPYHILDKNKKGE